MTSRKMTDSKIGPIPEDWDVKKLESIAPLQRGFDLPKKKQKKGPYPVVYSNGVCTYHNEYMVKGPGVITGRSGTIGHIHYVEQNFWPHNTALWVTKFFKNNPKFVYYLFQSFDWQAFSTGSGVPTLNRNFVHEKLLPLPTSIPEQIEIASALTSIDELLCSLEVLIEKKQNIKQGAMQELLSGRRRLPGYNITWTKTNIGTLCKPQKGKQINKNELKEEPIGYPVMNGGINPSGYHCDYNVKPDTIIISEGGNSCGFVSLMKEPFWAGGHCYILHPQEEINIEYLYQVLKYNESSLMSLRTGSGLPNITKNALNDFTFYYSPSLKEQNTIALILNDMDKEIEILEKRHEKYLAIKQGMMQQLLTGKIRLV